MRIELSNNKKGILINDNIIFENSNIIRKYLTNWREIIIVVESDTYYFAHEEKSNLFAINYNGEIIWRFQYINVNTLKKIFRFSGRYSNLKNDEHLFEFILRMNLWKSVKYEDNIIIARNAALKELPIDPYRGNILIKLDQIEDFNVKRGDGDRFK